MLQNRLQDDRASLQPVAQTQQPVAQTSKGVVIFGKIKLIFYLILLLFFYERHAPDEFKLSAVLGRFEGNIESSSMNAKLEATRAMVAAQEQEKAKADLEKQLAIVREQNKLELQKQQMLLKAQNDLELQKQLLVMRQQVISDSAKTRIELANTGQLFSMIAGATGNQNLANTIRQGGELFRAQAMHEVDQEMQRGLALMAAGSGQPAPDAAASLAPMNPAPRMSAMAQPVRVQQSPRQEDQQTSWQQRDKEAVARLVSKVVGPGFGCKNVKLTRLEELLCTVPELGQYDEVMTRVYKSLKKNLDKDRFAEIKKSNNEWFQKRNKDCQVKDNDSDAVQCLAVYTNKYRDVLLDTHHQLIGPFMVEKQI